jgi:aconitate hydratase
MVRGTFGNVRLRNELAPGREGDWTRHLPDGQEMRIFDASRRYVGESTPLLVVAGREYGSGSSRDWAAKGTQLLGVKAVLAESFERIHRSNLVDMGVVPLEFPAGETRHTWGLTGEETYDVLGLEQLSPHGGVTIRVAGNGAERQFTAVARVDSQVERDYLRHGGILPLVLRGMLGQQSPTPVVGTR